MAAVLIAIAPTALAQAPNVPAPRIEVPIRAASPDGYPPCSTARIYNLETTDGYLSVRAGPSARERELGRLLNGDPVFACVRDGNWFGIVFAQPGSDSDCGIPQSLPVSAPYAGPCGSGWVYHLYIGEYADWISP